VTYQWITLGDGRSVFRKVEEPKRARSHLPAPAVNTDTMEPTQHMADGKFYTSKAKFREVTRAHGCVEVGNDPARLRPKPKPRPDKQAIRQSIKKAIERHASGARPSTTAAA